MRYAARTDANQAEIVAAMRAACLACGSPVKRAGKIYCSRNCFHTSQIGALNGNWSNAGEKRCMLCGVHYHSYKKERQFCSQRCYHLTRPAVPTRCPSPPRIKKPTYCPKPPRPTRTITQDCRQCKEQFTSPMSSSRIYCSYACHLASGGAWRAGMAAAKATMKYGAKKDANHHEVASALEAIGVSVIDTSGLGGGFPDFILGFRGDTLLMELKNPKTSYGRRGLNPNQLKWKASWTGGPYAVVDGVEAAIRAVTVLGSSGGAVATVTDVDGALRAIWVMS